MFSDQYQSDIASIQGGIDCLSKILPARDTSLNVHEHGASAEVTAEVVKQATGVGGGIRSPIANVDAAHKSPSPDEATSSWLSEQGTRQRRLSRKPARSNLYRWLKHEEGPGREIGRPSRQGTQTPYPADAAEP